MSVKFFSRERREKILSYRFNVDRNGTVCVELLARYEVAEKFSCPFEKIRIDRDAQVLKDGAVVGICTRKAFEEVF